jgi:hypothetical protein
VTTNQRWAIATIVAGFALLISSAAWSYISPREMLWDEQDQQDYADAEERRHQAGHRLESAEQSRSKSGQAAAQEEFAAAQQALEAQEARLATAQAGLTWIPRLLFWSGVAAIFAGIVWCLRLK